MFVSCVNVDVIKLRKLFDAIDAVPLHRQMQRCLIQMIFHSDVCSVFDEEFETFRYFVLSCNVDRALSVNVDGVNLKLVTTTIFHCNFTEKSKKVYL